MDNIIIPLDKAQWINILVCKMPVQQAFIYCMKCRALLHYMDRGLLCACAAGAVIETRVKG